MGRYDPVEFCGELKHETDNAYLVFDGKNEIWIAKSQIQEYRQIDKNGTDFSFTIPEWLAIQEEII